MNNNTSPAGLIVLIVLALVLGINALANAQSIDTVQLGKDKFLLMKEYNAKTLMPIDSFGVTDSTITLKYKGVMYYGIMLEKAITPRGKGKEGVQIHLIYDPSKNTLWGCRRSLVLNKQ